MRMLNVIILFFILLILQVLVLSHFSATQYLSLYVFIMVVIIADMRIKGWVMLLFGAACGAVVDMVEGGGGLFTATTTWLAFVRPAILNWIVGRENIFSGGMPTNYKLGNRKFFTYLTFMVLMWTGPFFFLESIGNFSWIYTNIRIFTSSAVMVVLIYFLQLPFNKSRYDV